MFAEGAIGCGYSDSEINSGLVERLLDSYRLGGLHLYLPVEQINHHMNVGPVTHSLRQDGVCVENRTARQDRPKVR